MAVHRNVLLLGSVRLDTTEDVFRALAGQLGDRAKRYPDGETGERFNWTRWQKRVFEDDPAFELATARQNLKGFTDNIARPLYRLRAGVKARDVTCDNLGFATEATASYEVFARLKTEGVIPPAIRFQVSIPTPVAVINSFVVREAAAAVEPAYERAIKAEIEKIVAAILNDQLAIQWDVCVEVVGYDGGYPLFFDDVLENALERLCRLAGYVPEPVELGVHLCYGDPGHKHIIEPADTSTCVAFANGIAAGSPRSINWIHLPVPRGRDDDGYFAALDGLKLRPETELFLGLVHHTDGGAGTRRRIATAERHVADFGIATECGFGRRTASTIPALLDIHAEVAGP